MRILIDGYYGFGNLGDEALLAGLAAALQTRGHRIAVLSGDPERSRREHGLRAWPRRALVPALLASDALVSGGGGLLQDRTSRASLVWYLGVVAAARALRRPAAVYGQSVALTRRFGRGLTRRVLRGVPCAVRDRLSREALAELGIEAELVADAALLLPAGVEPSEPDPHAAVLLIPRGGYPEATAALATLGRRLLDRGLTLELLALHPQHDAAELRVLGESLPAARIRRAGDVAEVREVVAGARYVVSGRLHGLILAAAAGRPYAGLDYDPKVAAFLAETGAPGTPARTPDPELLERAVTTPLRPDAERVAAQVRRAERGVVWLERVLRGS